MRRGQAGLEYFILFSVLTAVAVVILFAYSKGGKQDVLKNYITGAAAGK